MRPMTADPADWARLLLALHNADSSRSRKRPSGQFGAADAPCTVRVLNALRAIELCCGDADAQSEATVCAPLDNYRVMIPAMTLPAAGDDMH
ncbi:MULTISPECIES: hypothetical protein [Burkholderiaceae]|uniref:hypothetical protein n=1 Tax=Burkholderiaceae TaxID=119060 RepID=UPI00096855A7|nr:MULTISPECIES: hypothetical protein [Burkholderiaceae]MCF2133693.1 hypothetical protein [Mycetohabitans sp. B3]MCG1039248.1 hypothetical protein [Mycetohabitans sp. B7]SIT68038.1 hypothetical protein SAMN04487769_1236 [Burkholderia sp. b14]